MESTRKLKAFTLLTIIFATLFVIDWYSKINTVRVITDNEDVVISSEIASRTAKYFDSNRTYFWRKKVKKTEQNTLIPFVVKTIIIEESNYKFYHK